MKKINFILIFMILILFSFSVSASWFQDSNSGTYDRGMTGSFLSVTNFTSNYKKCQAAWLICRRRSFYTYSVRNAHNSCTIFPSGFLAWNSWNIYVLYSCYPYHCSILFTYRRVSFQSCLRSYIYEA